MMAANSPSQWVILNATRSVWVERLAVGDVVWYPWTHVKPPVWRILAMLRVPIEHRCQGDEFGHSSDGPISIVPCPDLRSLRYSWCVRESKQIISY